LRPLGSTLSLDEQLLRLARTRGHTPALDRLAARLTLLGEHAGIWLAIGVVGARVDAPRRARWRHATRTVAWMYALNTAAKLAVRRSRPRLSGLPPLIATPTTLSFPSAHASTAFAGALAYSRLGLPAAPLYALAAKLSYSRLYLGVHYPSDVLAGALLGTALAAVRSRGSEEPDGPLGVVSRGAPTHGAAVHEPDALFTPPAAGTAA
jgi:membrane-associated phospholipid phosphatase